jgi:hypothetical protein
MAILSHADYLHRWTAPAPNGFGQTICPPCYHEYLQREIYFNDYLDLFRNVKTFVRRLYDGRFYVAITGCPILGILGIPEHDIFTINIDGILYLLVDYGYPWPEEELMKKRCIKYVMIGECAAPLKPVIPVNNNCIIPGGDLNNTFFYNILHLMNTPYMNAPRLAFNCPDYMPCPENKIETLLCLASKGVLLIDLFPFAIDYNNLNIDEQLILELFNSKINYINNVLCPYICKNLIKFAFIGRMNHSMLIIHTYPAINVCGRIININEESTLDFDSWIIRNGGVASLGDLAVNWHPLYNDITLFTHHLLVGNFRVHKYRAISKTHTGLYQPHEVNLRFAFNL